MSLARKLKRLKNFGRTSLVTDSVGLASLVDECAIIKMNVPLRNL